MAASDIQPTPLFIIGSPRSGTTYLQEVLNRHPEIFLTNETRIWIWVNRIINRQSQGRERLYSFKGEFLSHIMQELPALNQDFYQQLNNRSLRYWGDKYGNYADGEVDPECLGLINQLHPNCKFINIVRDGRGVVASLLNKGWSSLDEAASIWERHVIWARKFGTTLPADRYLEVSYESLTQDGVSQGQRLCQFLDLDFHPALESFLKEQQQAPTPFSNPITENSNIGAREAWRNHLDDNQIAQIEEMMTRVPLDPEAHITLMRDQGTVLDEPAFQPLHFERQKRQITIINDTSNNVYVTLSFEREGTVIDQTKQQCIQANSEFEWSVQWFDGTAQVHASSIHNGLSPIHSFSIDNKLLRHLIAVSDMDSPIPRPSLLTRIQNKCTLNTRETLETPPFENSIVPGSPTHSTDLTANDSMPLFIIGSPRSGTTYLQEVLNRHSEIFLTNESRIYIWLNRAMNRLSQGREKLYSYKGEYLTYLMEKFPAIIATFYTRLGATGKRYWGDKYGNYADGTIDPECLGLINQLYPNSRFIHIVRDRGSVVSSLVQKGWLPFDEANDTWERHLAWARKFGATLPKDRFLEVHYADLVNNGEKVGQQLCDFLSLEYEDTIRQFLQEQAQKPTPFSRPASGSIPAPDDQHWQEVLTEEQVNIIKELNAHTPMDATAHLELLKSSHGHLSEEAFTPKTFAPQWRHVVIVNKTNTDLDMYMCFESDSRPTIKTARRTIEANTTFEWGVQWSNGTAQICAARSGDTPQPITSVLISNKELRRFCTIDDALLAPPIDHT